MYYTRACRITVTLYEFHLIWRRGFESGFVNYKKGALDSQPQVIKFASCLPMVGGSLRPPGTPASSTTKNGQYSP